MTAADRLAQALGSAAARGETWPCRGRGEWVSDSTETRANAARWCVHCPVLALCHAAAVEQREKFGVWGGRDRENRQRERKQ